MPSPRKISRRALRKACEQVGPGDGLDPRYDRPDEPRPVTNRKALQLCGQIRDTLALVLAEGGDELLRGLWVRSVRPAPNTSRVVVTVGLLPEARGADPARVVERLAAEQPRLRAEVARAIHRRRTPELEFHVAVETDPAGH